MPKAFDPTRIPRTGVLPGAGLPSVSVSKSPTAPGARTAQAAVLAQLHGDQSQLVLIQNYLIPSVEANVVAWQCPAGHIGEFSHMAIYFSDPIIAVCQVIGWALCINNIRLPHLTNTTNGALYHAYGDIQDPAPIPSVILNSGDTISIRIYPVSGWAGYVRITGCLKGRAIATREGV